jgi:hypothetical protein
MKQIERVKSQGYTVGYTKACNYIRKKKKRIKPKKPLFVSPRLQEVAVSLIGENSSSILYKSSSDFNYRYLKPLTINHRYAVLYFRKYTLAFMKSHVDFDSHIESVYQELTKHLIYMRKIVNFKII